MVKSGGYLEFDCGLLRVKARVLGQDLWDDHQGLSKGLQGEQTVVCVCVATCTATVVSQQGTMQTVDHSSPMG